MNFNIYTFGGKYGLSVFNPTVVRFTLDYGNATEDIEFRPKGNAALLPSFLQTPISFEGDQAPNFLMKILEAIHADNE